MGQRRRKKKMEMEAPPVRGEEVEDVPEWRRFGRSVGVFDEV